MTQRHHRIDARGAPRRSVAGAERHDHEQAGGDRQHQRIVAFQTEQLRLRGASKSERGQQTEQGADSVMRATCCNTIERRRSGAAPSASAVLARACAAPGYS